MNPIVFFDLETAGLELQHPIIQIGAVAIKDGREAARFEAKLKFDVSLANPEALELNGYSAEAWAHAEEPLIVAKRFAKFLEPFKCIENVSKRTGKPYRTAQLGGYNASVFDAPRLQKLFTDLDLFLPVSYKVLDVMQLVLWWDHLNPNSGLTSHKLGNVCEFFGIKLENAHDALSDVVATAMLAGVLTKNA